MLGVGSQWPPYDNATLPHASPLPASSRCTPRPHNPSQTHQSAIIRLKTRCLHSLEQRQALTCCQQRKWKTLAKAMDTAAGVITTVALYARSGGVTTMPPGLQAACLQRPSVLPLQSLRGFFSLGVSLCAGKHSKPTRQITMENAAKVTDTSKRLVVEWLMIIGGCAISSPMPLWTCILVTPLRCSLSRHHHHLISHLHRQGRLSFVGKVRMLY